MPTYACPEFFSELLNKNDIDHGIDIWALGVLIHALAFGELPYSREEILD